MFNRATSRLVLLTLLVTLVVSNSALGGGVQLASTSPLKSQVFGLGQAVPCAIAMSADSSDSIVVQGEVLRIISVLEEPLIVSYVTISVSQVVIGLDSLCGTEIILKHLGGEVNGVLLWLSDQPYFAVGELVEVTVRQEGDVYIPVSPKTTLATPPNVSATAAGYLLEWYKPGVGWQSSTTSPGTGWYGPAKWASGGFEYWINTQGIPADLSASSFITYATASFQTWEDDPGSSIDFTYQGTGINVPETRDWVNSVGWGSIGGSTIARTMTWYSYSPWNYDSLRITETDIKFDNSKLWSAQSSGVTGRFDVQNIGTHEAGHTFGLADLYDLEDSEQTMHGYSSTGETKGRTLEWGDRAGVAALYPSVGGYTVTFKTNPTSFAASPGTITVSGSTYSNGQTGSFVSGDYTATANAPTDYSFHHWEYSGSSGSGVYVPNINANPTTVQVRGDGWLNAIFSAKITFYTSPSSGGSITWGSGPSYTHGQTRWEVNLPPNYGNTATITANPPTGYTFSSWSKSGMLSVASSSSNPTTLTVNGPGTITANFATGFEFSLSNSGGITVTKGSSGSNTITVTLISGTTQSVSLSASGLPSGASASFNPTSGNPTFTSTCTISTSSSTPTGSYTITVTGTRGGVTRTTTFTLTVNPQTYTVTVYARKTDGSAISGVQVTFGSQSKTTDSSGKAAFPTSAGTYSLSVQSPVSGGSGIRYVFTQWTDGNAQNPRSITVTASVTYNARYKTQYQLTMQVNPSGAGSTSPPVGSYWYDAGTAVTIQASPASGYTFSSWTGSGTGSYSGKANPTSVTTNGPITETANFASGFVLHVQSNPITGVSISYTGSYSGSGTTNFDIGPKLSPFTITLKAPSTSGSYRFSYWTLDGSNMGSSTSLTVTVDLSHKDRAAIAIYVPATWKAAVDVLLSVYNSRPDLKSAYPGVTADWATQRGLIKWAATCGITIDSAEPQLGRYGHLYVLADVYNSRPDLQSAYPEVTGGNLKGLISWAAKWGITIDSARQYLGWYGHIYVLLDIYNNRPDLQTAYPQVVTGDLGDLIDWVAKCGIKTDSAKPILEPYSHLYGLLNIYYSRLDLMNAYPGALGSHLYFERLIDWAARWGITSDSAKSTLQPYAPQLVLLMVYGTRPDLQQAMPAAFSYPMYQSLINWAAQWGITTDSARPILEPYASWYQTHKT